MQKTGNPITFRDANTFYHKAMKAQRTQSDWMRRPILGGKSRTNRMHRAAVKARANLQHFSIKLVEKSVSQVFSDLLMEPVPINNQDVINISASLAMAALPGTDNGWNNLLDGTADYKNSEAAKFSLNGQTLSSVVKHFSMRSDAIFKHQCAVASNIYWTIREKVLEISNERSKPTI